MSAADVGCCICGCGQLAKTGSRYASDACRARRYDQKNPRVSKAPLGAMAREIVLRAPPEALERYRDEMLAHGKASVSFEAELGGRLVETIIQPNTLEGYDPENPHMETQTISWEEAERRWPGVSKAPPELLKRRLDHERRLRAQMGSEFKLSKDADGLSVYVRRRPRPPRIHIDVLGEDAELLDRLACEAGISRTAYVSYLIRRAGGRDIE